MPHLISRRELAKQLGLSSPAVLANWSARGFGPPVVKVGSLAMYDPADVEAFIASRKRTSTSQELAPASAA